MMTINPTVESMAADLRKSLGQIGELPEGEAYLGKGDGTSTVIADPTRRLIYVNDGSGYSRVLLGHNLALSDVADSPGTRVKLGRPNYDPDRVYVTGFPQTSAQQAFGGQLPREQQQQAALYPDVGRIRDFRVTPQSPPALSVHVNGGSYYDANGNWQTFGGDDLDDAIAAAVAALSGEHQMGVVVFDISTAELSLLTNAAVSGGAADKDIFNATTVVAILAGQINIIPCGTIHLYDGQTGIVEDDFYRAADPRVVFDAVRSAGSGTDLIARKRSWFGI